MVVGPIMKPAIIFPCEHEAHTEHCWNCAPWWGKLYVCPVHISKLNKSGFCIQCKKYYEVEK
jgi:hypothetical protein